MLQGSSNDVKVGGWGGNGGSGEWEFIFPGGSALSKIQVVHNEKCIYSLLFTTFSQKGTQTNSKKYGGVSNLRDGKLEQVCDLITSIYLFNYLYSTHENCLLICIIINNQIQLGYGEVISEVRGTIGEFDGVTVITSLTFTIGSKELGPYGLVAGTAFSLPVLNGKITGFWGNADKYLDSLGVFLANPIN